jgi:hypothetical protein
VRSERRNLDFNSEFRNPQSTFVKKEEKMPRSERKREIARRRKRRKETRKLRAKGLLPPVEGRNETEKKKAKKAPAKTVPEPSAQ